jgi:hypothetical protein
MEINTQSWSLARAVPPPRLAKVDPDPTALPEETAPAVAEPQDAGDGGAGPRRPGKAHIQQTLHHLERIVRHSLHDALKEAGDLDPATRREIRGLEREYRHDVRDLFLAAGRGRDFQPALILEGLGAVTREFTDGLRALRGAAEELPPSEEPTTPILPGQTPARDPVMEPAVDAGTSLSLYA